MKDIPIELTTQDIRPLKMSSPYFTRGSFAGVTWDDNAIRLSFERPEEFADFNMYLRFEYPGAVFKPVGLGDQNVYELPRLLTIHPELRLLVMFYDGDKLVTQSNTGVLRFDDDHPPMVEVSFDEINYMPYAIPGPAGYSPVKGTDYFTAEEIAEIEAGLKEYIDAQLGVISDGSY